MATTIDSEAALEAFDRNRDQCLAALADIPTAALGYLRPGDDYSLGGLVHHLNYVLEHYTVVLAAMAGSKLGECRPQDPAGLEERARLAAAGSPSRADFESALTRMRDLHAGARARLAGFGGEWDRKAEVHYGNAAEAYPTSAADVLGWLDGHYREHVPQIAGLIAEWAGARSGAEALAVVDRFNERFAAGDVDGIMALMTDDCLFENTLPAPDGSIHRGQEAVRAFWADFFATTHNPRFETEDAFAAGDRVCARWRFSWGAAGGEGSGHVRGVDVFRVRDGKVAEKLSYVKG